LSLGIAAALTLGWIGALPAQSPSDSAAARRIDSKAIFYRDVTYGNLSSMGPFDVMLNKGFAVAQFQNRSRKIFDYDYGTRHVWDALTDPLGAIRRHGGWGTFVRKELLPLELDPTEWKWAPNYFGHVMEGGITFRRLAEWYQARGVPGSVLLAAATTYGAALMNESYSHPGYRRGTPATVADLLFFDPLGMILFSRDDVSRFFADRLGATVWTGQAAVTPSGELVNNGNNLILKLPSPFAGTSTFVRTGLAFTVGLTFHGADDLDLSVAFGVEGEQQKVDPDTGEETPTVGWGGGVYWDRGGSLLASVVVSQVRHRFVTVNVYPGVVPAWGGRLGGWLLVRRGGSLRFGISLRRALGLGIAGGVN
jgi:hypothetical protein